MDVQYYNWVGQGMHAMALRPWTYYDCKALTILVAGFIVNVKSSFQVTM